MIFDFTGAITSPFGNVARAHTGYIQFLSLSLSFYKIQLIFLFQKLTPLTAREIPLNKKKDTALPHQIHLLCPRARNHLKPTWNHAPREFPNEADKKKTTQNQEIHRNQRNTVRTRNIMRDVHWSNSISPRLFSLSLSLSVPQRATHTYTRALDPRARAIYVPEIYTAKYNSFRNWIVLRARASAWNAERQRIQTAAHVRDACAHVFFYNYIYTSTARWHERARTKVPNEHTHTYLLFVYYIEDSTAGGSAARAVRDIFRFIRSLRTRATVNDGCSRFFGVAARSLSLRFYIWTADWLHDHCCNCHRARVYAQGQTQRSLPLRSCTSSISFSLRHAVLCAESRFSCRARVSLISRDVWAHTLSSLSPSAVLLDTDRQKSRAGACSLSSCVISGYIFVFRSDAAMRIYVCVCIHVIYVYRWIGIVCTHRRDHGTAKRWFDRNRAIAIYILRTGGPARIQRAAPLAN